KSQEEILPQSPPAFAVFSASILLLAVTVKADARSLRTDIAERCGVFSRPGRILAGSGFESPSSGSSTVPLLGDAKTLNGQGAKVVAAVRREFGLDSECLRVVVLDHSELEKRAQAVD